MKKTKGQLTLFAMRHWPSAHYRRLARKGLVEAREALAKGAETYEREWPSDDSGTQ